MNPAAHSRQEKEAHPERYCVDRRCLWNVRRSGPCPRHQTSGYVLAGGVCPLCLAKDNRHESECPRGTSAEHISQIIERLPDLT